MIFFLSAHQFFLCVCVEREKKVKVTINKRADIPLQAVLCSETLEAKLQNIVIKSGTMKSCQHVKYCKYSEGLLPTFLKAVFRNRTNDISYCVQKRWQSHKTIPHVLRNVGPSEY
jgi:hypothetical protein